MYPESAVWTSWFGIGFQYKAWIAASAREKILPWILENRGPVCPCIYPESYAMRWDGRRYTVSGQLM